MKKIFISMICFAGLTACKTLTIAQSTYIENVNEIKSLLNDTDLNKNYNGSILIADGQNTLLEQSFGFDQSNEPNQIDTKYEIASIGKMFTSVAIMQLVEKKKIFLNQTIGEILHDYPNESAKVITIEQLLSHTSGLGDFFGPEFDKNRESVKTLADHLSFFVHNPLEFEPGERMRYSNAGFIVLGLIIEKVSGIDYNSYIHKNILKPANMSSTGPLSSSAGGGTSTVTDLYKFAHAIKSTKLISNASFNAMTTDHYNNGYGYGMSLRNLNGKQVYGHNGGAPGVSGELDMVKEASLIIVTLSNRSPMDGWAQVRTNIRKAFFGSTPEIEQFLNTENVVQTYKEYGFEKASELLTKLNNNISDKNTFFFCRKICYARATR